SDDLSTETKAALIRQLTGRYRVEGFQETVFETASKTTESLVRVYVGKDKRLTLPEALPLTATNAETPSVKTKDLESADVEDGENVLPKKVGATKTANEEPERVENKRVADSQETDDGEEEDLRLEGFFDVYVDWDYESDFRLDDE
ncbi:MAG: hypothetical protein IJ991_15510, partial [Thermoguttaceae bacterium]|nr:hypothetical protein [Thermoguttaceae bacterium]